MTLDLYDKVTLIATTTRDYDATREAVERTLCRITAKVLIFSDRQFCGGDRVKIEPFGSSENACIWTCTKLPQILASTATANHLLGVQHDGYVVNEAAWCDEWLEYDYVAPPWGDNEVGNGGFTLASRFFWECVGKLNLPQSRDFCYQSDINLCRPETGPFRYRQRLEAMGVKYAPYDVAERFATLADYSGQFGFHGIVSKPQIEHFGLDRGERWTRKRIITVEDRGTLLESMHGTWETVHVKNASHGISGRSLADVVRMYHSVLNPGGLLMISCPDRQKSISKLLTVDANELAKIMSDVGLEGITAASGVYGNEGRPDHFTIWGRRNSKPLIPWTDVQRKQLGIIDWDNPVKAFAGESR